MAAVRIEQRAVGAELEHDLREPGVQHPGSLLGLIPAGDHHGLVAVHQQQRGAAGELQEGLGPDAPERGRGRAVHRHGHAGPLGMAEGRQRGFPGALVEQGVPGDMQVAPGREQVLRQVIRRQRGIGARVGEHGVVTLVGHHHDAGPGLPLGVHDQPRVDPVAHQFHVPVTAGDVRSAPSDEGHLGPVNGEPGGNIRAGATAVHGHRGRRVTALGQRKGRVRDRVRHEIANDDNACHVATTLITEAGPGRHADRRQAQGLAHRT